MRTHTITILAIWMLVVPFSLFSYNEVIEYNNRNQVSQIDFDNGYSIDYNYDSHGNLTNLIITQPNIAPLSPSQFTIASNGDLITLSWEPVTSNINGTPIIVPLYVIEASTDPTTGFTQIGTTNQTQYTISSTAYQHCFFRVRAVINYQRGYDLQALEVDTETSAIGSKE